MPWHTGGGGGGAAQCSAVLCNRLFLVDTRDFQQREAQVGAILESLPFSIYFEYIKSPGSKRGGFGREYTVLDH